jgi:hypothetical protein
MSNFNSSKTRVVPVFDQLLARDRSGQSWLHNLLQLPKHGSGAMILSDLGVISRVDYGQGEAKLPPPRSLLHWLIDHPEAMSPPKNLGNAEATRQRKALLAGDTTVMKQAHSGVDSGRLSTMWYTFEKPSQPDVYIETDRVVVVIEGKRTESGPTTKTTWMPVRHQMLRHLDCALDSAKQKQLYGFFLVEGSSGDIPAVWQAAAIDTVSQPALHGSLPHRTESEIDRIRQSFLGVSTWQRVCGALGLPGDSLPDTVRD